MRALVLGMMASFLLAGCSSGPSEENGGLDASSRADQKTNGGAAGAAPNQGGGPASGPGAEEGGSSGEPGAGNGGEGESGEDPAGGNGGGGAGSGDDGRVPRFPMVGITELHLGSDVAQAWVALELNADFGDQDNDCHVLTAASVRVHDPGPYMLSTIALEGQASWRAAAYSGGLGYANAHAGPADTRSLVTTEGSGGTFLDHRILPRGDVRLTLVVHGAEVQGDPALAAGFSWGYSMVCASPFTLVSAATGTQAFLADVRNLSGGAGVEAFVAGSVNVLDEAGLSSTATTTRAAAGGFGPQAAVVQMTHPLGTETWTFIPDTVSTVAPNYYAIDGDGSGEYVCTVARGAAAIHALWCGAWGLEAKLDLEGLWQAGSVVNAPEL